MVNLNIVEAIEFKDSPRGRLIMAQALVCGIKYLEQTDGVMREISNIADMRYLLERLYSEFIPVFAIED